MIREAQLQEELRQAGLRATRARAAVLALIQSAREPQSAHDIARSLKGRRVDLVTVYRTLEAFRSVGLVKEIDLRRSSAYFEYNDRAHHHHHIVCRSCGKTEDVEGCNLEMLQKKAIKSSSQFSTISSHSLEFFGDCRVCVPSR